MSMDWLPEETATNRLPDYQFALTPPFASRTSMPPDTTTTAAGTATASATDTTTPTAADNAGVDTQVPPTQQSSPHQPHPPHRHPRRSKLHTSCCLLAGEHLSVRGPYSTTAAADNRQPTTATTNPSTAPTQVPVPTTAATAAPLQRPHPPLEAVLPVSAAAPAATSSSSDGSATNGSYSDVSAVPARTHSDVSETARSYSDGWPLACPGVMHHDGHALISVHALPQEEGFCIDLAPGSVMSHPLNMCPEPLEG